MSVIQGILLGILQGVAEFLPISSSGHLLLAQKLFGLDEVPLLFDVFLHLATLLAVCLYFWRKIWKLLKTFCCIITRRPVNETQTNSEDLLCGTDKAARKTILAIIITTFITAALGIFTSKKIPELSAEFTYAGFLITAILLIVSELKARKIKSDSEKSENNSQQLQPQGISVKQSVVIGIMQGFGTLPGISRSGSSIAGALYSGVNAKAAGDFSFIVSIPAILGAFILELKDLGEVSETVGFWPVFAGCISAFVVGYSSLVILMKLIRRGKLAWFAAYLIPLGIAGLIFLK